MVNIFDVTYVHLSIYVYHIHTCTAKRIPMGLSQWKIAFPPFQILKVNNKLGVTGKGLYQNHFKPQHLIGKRLTWTCFKLNEQTC